MMYIVTAHTMRGRVITVRHRRSLLASSVAAGACGMLMIAAPCYAQTASQQQTTIAQTEITTPAAIHCLRRGVPPPEIEPPPKAEWASERQASGR